MTNRARFLFDECIGWPLVEELARMLDPGSQDIELAHAVKMGFGGINDDVWKPQIAADGWVIVSGDRGSRQKVSKGQKLPVVCRQFGVSHVLLSASVNKCKAFVKVRAIFAVWDGLLKVAAEPRGAGYTQRATNSGKFILQKSI